jgi:magnesium/cobalt transport protein CorA
MDIIHFTPNHSPQRVHAVSSIRSDDFLWFDFERAEANDWVQTVNEIIGCEIHEHHLTDSLNESHPPYFDSLNPYEMLIMQSLGNHDWHSMETHPLAFFLFDRFLVTIHTAPHDPLNQFKTRLLSGNALPAMRTERLLHLLLNLVINQFLELRAPLSEQFDSWRVKLLRRNFREWKQLLNQQRQLRKLEFVCEQQMDALTAWREETQFTFDDHTAVRFNDLHEHLQRVLRHVHSLQKEIEFLVQLQFSVSSDYTNNVMRILTIFSVIFLPLNLIAGIFGMNFEHMSFLHNSDGVLITLSGMLGLSALLLFLFKLNRWL